MGFNSAFKGLTQVSNFHGTRATFQNLIRPHVFLRNEESECKVVPYVACRYRREVKVLFRSVLTSPLDEGEWLTARSG